MRPPFARYAKGGIAAHPSNRMRSNPAQYKPNESSIDSYTKRYAPCTSASRPKQTPREPSKPDT